MISKGVKAVGQVGSALFTGAQSLCNTLGFSQGQKVESILNAGIQDHMSVAQESESIRIQTDVFKKDEHFFQSFLEKYTKLETVAQQNIELI